MPKVSLDYDGVLSTPKGIELAKRLISEGKDIYIVTARNSASDWNSGLFNRAKELGINRDKIYFTNGADKWKTLERLGIITHYDNNQEQLDKISKNTKTRAIKF
jgi:hypothetical protein